MKIGDKVRQASHPSRRGTIVAFVNEKSHTVAILDTGSAMDTKVFRIDGDSWFTSYIAINVAYLEKDEGIHVDV